MNALNTPLLTIALSLSAIFLGLSLFVQVLQEFYKFITSSKSRAYKKALIDFSGPWVKKLYEPATLINIVARGPFQIFRRRPTGKVLPMDKENIVKALEQTAPTWHQQALKLLENEVKVQSGKEQSPSSTWNSFVDELATCEKGTPGYWSSQEVIRFLKNWGYEFPDAENKTQSSVNKLGTIDAVALSVSFRQQFFSHLNQIEEHYTQFMNNFEYMYRRRNLRLCFSIGLLVALFFNLPLNRIYQRASRTSDAEAIRMANEALALYAQYQTQEAQADSTGLITNTQTGTYDSLMTTHLKRIETVEKSLLRNKELNYVIEWKFIKKLWARGWMGIPRYLLGCILTALLISFGAPFWNDLADSLLSLKRRK